MQRREFITLLTVAATWPVIANGQQPVMPTVGFLHNATLDARRKLNLEEFLRGLAETGYVVGKNVAIEYRWAENRNDQLLPLAMDLVRREVAVIATPGSTASALAAKAAIRQSRLFS
jgi:putative ABC transport system substrate-binding protein